MINPDLFISRAWPAPKPLYWHTHTHTHTHTEREREREREERGGFSQERIFVGCRWD